MPTSNNANTQMFHLTHPTTGETLDIDEFWLRDHCSCQECHNTETNQRRYDLLDLDANVRVLDSRYEAGERLVVQCKCETTES